MLNDTEIGISIGFTIKKLSSVNGAIDVLNKLSTRAKKAGADVSNLNKRILKINDIKLSIDTRKNSISKELNKATSIITKSVSFALPVKLAVDYEDAFADINKVVDFDTIEEKMSFKKDLLNLSKELVIDSVDLTAITAAGGQMGVAKENLLEFTRLTGKMAIAFDMSTEAAGENIGKIMGILGLDLSSMSELSDTINGLSNSNPAKAGEIVEVLKRIAGLGKQIGLTKEEISGLAASFLALGKTPETASTAANALMKTLANIRTAGKKEMEALEVLGLDASYVASKMALKPKEMIMEFLQAANKIDPSKRGVVLNTLFGSNFDSDIATMVGSIDKVKKIMDDAGNKELYRGSTDKEFEARINTTKNKLTGLKITFTNLGIKIGEAFLPTFNALLFLVNGFGTAITKFVDKFPKLSNIIFGVVGGFLAFGVVVPIAKIAFNAFMIGLASFRIAWQAVLFGFELFRIKTLLSIKALIAHSMAVVAAAIKNRLFAASVMLVKTRLMTSVVASVLYTKTIKVLSFVCKGVGKAFRALALGIRVVSIAMKSNPIGLILGAIAIIAGVIIYNWDKVKAWFMKFIEWIRPVFGYVVGDIKEKWSALTSFFKGLIDGIKSFFEPFFEWIEEKFGWISDMYQNITGKVSGLIDGAKGVAGSVADFGSGAVKSVWNNTKSFFGFGNDDDLIKEIVPAKAVASNNQNYNFNFGDINPNIDEAGLKRAVIKEMNRQSLNAYNRNFTTGAINGF